MAQDFDPVTTGIVASLARPGGNVTGLATLYPEMTGKQLELLKEIVPRLHRVTILGNSTVPGNSQSVKESKMAAETLGIRIAYAEVRRQEEIESVFSTAKKAHADAVLALASPLLTTYRKELVEFSLKSRLPTIYGRPEMVDDGGLMTYGVSVNDLFRRAATYVDKVLKGAKPADLPIEQPTKFEFLINLKAAKQIGLTIPDSVLFRADRVIK
jgi:putative ABC transport system substrate-binding protein